MKTDLTKIVGAGVMLVAAAATVAGVYQLVDRPAPPPDSAVRAGAAAAEPPPPTVDPELAAAAEAGLAQLRAFRAEQARRERASKRIPTRCIAGTLFQVEGDAWTNVGRC